MFLKLKLVEKVLGVSPYTGRELMYKSDFPVLRTGNRLVVPWV